MSISNLVSCKPNSAALNRLHRSYDVRMTREILQSMAKRVRVLREDAGLNQIELAAEVRRRGVSCSNSLVSSIETGRANLSIEVFIAIADALDVTLDYLATRTNVIESPQAESAPTPPVMWHAETDEVAAVVDKWNEFSRLMFLDIVRAMDDRMRRHHALDVETVEGAGAFADRILSGDSSAQRAVEQTKSAKRN